MPLAKLKEQQATQMIKLEQLFHNRYLTPQFLHQLIAIYVKAIQSFSGQFNFMRMYFMDKMQFVLSCPQIISMLQGGGNMAESIRQTIRMTERPIQIPKKSEKNREEDQNRREKQKEKNKEEQIRFKQVHHQNHHHFHHQHEQHHYYHYDETKNNQKGMKIDMKMKVMREVQQNMKNIHNQVNEADRKLVEKEEKIKDIAKDQDKIFNERLAKRKNKLRKKSVQIKAKKTQNQQAECDPEPIIQKQQLKEAQRELTHAILKFTVRMTERQKQKQKLQFKKDIKKMKKARNIQQDDMLLEQQEENDEQIQAFKKKEPTVQIKGQKITQGRAKTKRRNLDSDDDL